MSSVFYCFLCVILNNYGCLLQPVEFLCIGNNRLVLLVPMRIKELNRPLSTCEGLSQQIFDSTP